MKLAICLILAILTAPLSAQDNKTRELQDISVTIRSNMAQGSGVLITRKIGKDTVTFVWTAAHVVDDLRRTRTVVDGGINKTVVEFGDAGIVQEFKQDGRRVGETKLDCQVIRYSDAYYGEDLALLRVRRKNYLPETITANFYLGPVIPDVGTKVTHVGSLLGQFGANSFTTGVIAQTGRVLKLGREVIFDQTTAPAFPGSSGGGIFMEQNNLYIGMLVRGADATFNFMVPVRRMHEWAKKSKVEWAIDSRVKMPTEEELAKLPVEDTGIVFPKYQENKQDNKDFLIKRPKIRIVYEH